VEFTDLKALRAVVRSFVAPATCALLLAACVPTGLPETVLPPALTYACQDGTALHVTRLPDASAATVAVAGRSARLMRTDSPAQEKYTDGPTTLYLDGNRALLISDSFVVAGPCVSTVPLPVVQPWQPR
jgi:membrane-bound inhibitor of C-type lysozyme